MLQLIAVALAGRRAERAASVDRVDERIIRLEVPAGAAWQWTGEALLGQLRAIAASVSQLDRDYAGSAAAAHARTALAAEPGIAAWSLTTVKANANLASEAGRHALRLAAVAGLGEVLVQATGLEEGHWVVLTIFLVLKPDYSSTVSRGVQRSVGTVLGAGLGVAAAQLGKLGSGGLIAAAGGNVAIAYAMFDVSYLAFSVFLTAFIVVLLAILGIPAAPTAEARLIATAIGSVLAVGAYIAWPTWEGVTAYEKFSRLLEAHRDYSTALLRTLADPGRGDLARLRTLQVAPEHRAGCRRA